MDTKAGLGCQHGPGHRHKIDAGVCGVQVGRYDLASCDLLVPSERDSRSTGVLYIAARIIIGGDEVTLLLSHSVQWLIRHIEAALTLNVARSTNKGHL